MTSTYHCRCCGEEHPGPPLGYGFEAPAAWYGVPAAERARRTLLSGEQCEIDNEFFFIKANIELPVRDGEGPFVWTVWVSLSRANYARAMEQWRVEGREADPPVFGWLSVKLPYTPTTLNLKTMVYTRPVGLRPLVELEPTDHPLAIEQREGITMERVLAIAERALHPNG